MLNEIGSSQAFFLIVPVLAGFISSSIADKPGFAPGAIGGLIAVTYGHGDATSSGFLGGLIAGFLAGYVTLGIKKSTIWSSSCIGRVENDSLLPCTKHFHYRYDHASDQSIFDTSLCSTF